MLKSFLETYTSKKVQDASTLRRQYAPTVYDGVIEEIRRAIGTSKIWVSIDETTDHSGRYIANVVVGKLNGEEPSKSYLLTCEHLEKTNASTIAQVFVKAMKLLWKNDVQYELVLLFVTDAASYMKKAAASLQVLFPKMLHITCVAHGLHRVSEFIRGLFPDVDRLVANMKMAFLKSPSRINRFKENLSIPVPPKPVVTRWGTWIKAVQYYHENFDQLREFVCSHLDRSEI